MGRFLTGNGHPESDGSGEPDPVQDEGNNMLAPEDVLCITAASYRSDFAPEIVQTFDQ